MGKLNSIPLNLKKVSSLTHYSFIRYAPQFTNQYPGGKGGNYIIIASSPKATRVKRTESGKGTIVKPAYFVAANETTKEVVISIRGSHEIEDLTVDGTANNVEFEIFGNKYSCHNGMLESANWLGYEGKMIQYTKELFNRSYKIVLTGHSLGAHKVNVRL